jgi:signal transduction histidine kinase
MTRTESPEAIDIRWVFRIYAVVAFGAGLFVTGWGQQLLGDHMIGQPWGRAALIRVFGSILMAAACFAAGLAAVEDRRAQRQGLFWFAVGHFVVFLVTLSQKVAVWPPGTSDLAPRVLFAVVFVLFYLWVTSEGERLQSPIISLFRGAPESHSRLRSRYEEQIRAAARQEERNRLARDLHDSIKQQIFVIQTAAATAQARFGGDETGTKQALDQVRDSAREAMAEMEAMLDQMAAAPLENTGLVEAIKKQCEAFGFRTGAKVEFKLGDMPESRALPAGAHEAILRVTQEALSNIARHARAGRVGVTLGIAGGALRLSVDDDGAGFDAAAPRAGQGIANMRTRAAEFDGAFELSTRPGGGTFVAFSVPYEQAVPAAIYKRKAIEVGAALAGAVLLQTFWRRSEGMIMWTAIAAIWTLRYVVAYRRSLRRAQ